MEKGYSLSARIAILAFMTLYYPTPKQERNKREPTIQKASLEKMLKNKHIADGENSRLLLSKRQKKFKK